MNPIHKVLLSRDSETLNDALVFKTLDTPGLNLKEQSLGLWFVRSAQVVDKSQIMARLARSQVCRQNRILNTRVILGFIEVIRRQEAEMQVLDGFFFLDQSSQFHIEFMQL